MTLNNFNLITNLGVIHHEMFWVQINASTLLGLPSQAKQSKRNTTGIVSRGFMSSENHRRRHKKIDEEEVNKLIDLNKDIIKQENEVRLDGDDVLPDVADPNIVMEEVTECMRTPRATLYETHETPRGSIYWEPHVEGIPIPVEGTYYDTIDEALDMYTKYAEMAGFEIKKGGQRLTKSGAVQHKYIYCNKEGVPKGINVDTLDPEYNDKQKRNTTTHVTGCKARIRLVRNTVNGRYKLEQFQPKHNHMLIPKEYKHFTKKQRKMNQSEKMFVVKAATNKIGATRAHNLLCSMKGGYEYVHGTTDDFKNHQRDVNVFIGESDAQMLINKMENRKMYVPNFTFQYRVENSELVAMFWADEVAKCNYKEFGDIVSFDATFNSNKYNMKFVPFIGIDNHGKCVTLGSGMLLHEDTKSYTWLLNAFMTAFSHEPTMIVTDQDGAMKRAIEAVFKKAKHRLCMWHIMQKILSKICKEIYDETNFKERFDKIVWNMFIEPLKFEEKWSELIEDFGLQSHKWSESENSFFKSFTSPGATLVSFMMSYESAMERQRYRQEALDFKTIEAAPKCETKLAIELHAARVYTRTIFLLVQTEINEVHFEALDKGHNTPDLRRQRNRYGEKNLTIERLTNEAKFLVDDSLFLLSKDEGNMGADVEKLKILLDEVKADMPNPPSRNIGDVIGGIFSITKPNQIDVQNPTKAVNK
ncbi:FAR1-related sequence 5-like protein [Tanacetum coccineum]|uniref:FAR1-related sequence 5-like protein n=1 Tax=Tanacetum coccineum TaxID=301880 RepID=A0ABQ5E5L8_9ASTR